MDIRNGDIINHSMLRLCKLHYVGPIRPRQNDFVLGRSSWSSHGKRLRSHGERLRYDQERVRSAEAWVQWNNSNHIKVAYIWIVSVVMQVLADIIFTSVFSRMVGGTRLNQYWIENIEEQWTIGIDMILSMTSSIILTG